MLVSILEVFLELLRPRDEVKADDDTRASVKEYLRNLARVPRFPTVLLFLTSAERAVAKNVCEVVGDHIEGWDL